MKTLSLLPVIAVVCFCAGVQAQVNNPVGFGQAECWNDGWEFSMDSIEWRPVTLPHDWSIEATPSDTLASCTGYLPGGVGWYRKGFTSGAVSKRAYVCFDGVYNRSTVWLNSHELGYRPNGYVSFCYELTDHLNKADDRPDTLLVRVDHSRQADSRWYTGSGIWRDVWLVRSPEVHLAQ